MRLSPHPAPHRSAGSAWKHVPMSKEPWSVLSNSIEPDPCLGWLASQSFELVHNPPNDVLVDALCEGVQLGAVEGPVIIDPASDLGIDAPGEVG